MFKLPTCYGINKRKQREACDQHYVSECPFPLFILSFRTPWVTHPPLVNKACLYRVIHTLFLSSPGLNLTSAVPLTIWKSTSAFVKPPPCVYCSSVTHGVALIFKPAGARKNKNQRKKNFVVWIWKAPQMEKKCPFSFFCVHRVPILEDSEYSHTDLRIWQHFQNGLSPLSHLQTPMNQASTRSHCIFTVHLCRRELGSTTLWRSKLHLVDLAGSDRVSKTGLNGQLLTEAKYINLSLHYLEQVTFGNIFLNSK